ncbi:hypothetical protein [Vibrio pectenicida]|uniref:Uncharacterized protein n=1 Tax=Vibrio pectenicida TaxID=62763 RepID=A0A3R9F7M9_9VIBR|nr:hypothetical protein [Vibrio pectenicida]RSD31729.1 hypothetical protein EJA03_07330 [Vibrio pectenicida]
MSNSSSRKKALIKFALHTLLVVGVSTSITIVAVYWLGEKNASARNSLKQVLLAEIQSHSESQSAAIAASEQKHTQDMQPFITRLETLDNQVLLGKQEHQHFQDAIDTLKSQQEGQTKGIQTLNKKVRALARRPTSKKTVSPSVKKRPQSNVSTTELPFRLFDVQKRGLSYVAIMGPKQTDRVKKLMVLSAGHRYQGWRLDSVTQSGVQVSQGNIRLFLERQGEA